jgi:hypothetical protein
VKHVQEELQRRELDASESSPSAALAPSPLSLASWPRVSERRVCRVLDQPRSTQRYEATPRDDQETALVKRLHEPVREHPRRGYRMMWGMLRLEGWRVNRKRIHRLWKREGFRVPGKQHKKRRLGSSEHGIVRRRADRMNHVWCVDFIHDRDEQGRTLKWLSVVDELGGHARVRGAGGPAEHDGGGRGERADGGSIPLPCH